MNEIGIDLSKCIDNFKIDKDKVKQYGGYKKIAIDLSKENMRLAFENHILQSKIDKAIEFCDYSFKNPWYVSEKELLGKIIDILKEAKNVENN